MQISIVIGTDDPIIEKYKRNYKDNLLIFEKDDINVDLMNNFNEKKFPIFAREFVYTHAKKQGVTHYIILEEDYSDFSLRYIKNNKLMTKKMDINKYFVMLLKLTDKFKNKIHIGLSQGGDYIGGAQNADIKRGYRLKLMNSYFININYPIHFKGSINDDVNTAILLPITVGGLPYTIMGLSLTQKETQSNGTALKDIYEKYSTYTKSMYTVLLYPASVTVTLLRINHPRIHHNIHTNQVYPKLLDEKYKK